MATGGLAGRLGRLLGIGSTAVRVWDIAKWPVLLLIVGFLFALLYWASPNARQPFRWITPGGILAVVVWVVASVAFALYVANIGSYNKAYGSLASVIIFLVWLWLSNTAILLGAELERSRAIAAGHPPDEEPYGEPSLRLDAITVAHSVHGSALGARGVLRRERGQPGAAVHHIDPDRGRAFEPTVATIPFILTRPETHHPEATPWPAGERAASGHETSG